MEKKIEDLLEVINDNSSVYEDEYIKYVNIHFDKKSLTELLYELKYLTENNTAPERQEVLKNILAKYDIDHLFKLLVDDPDVARFAQIEKWARIAAIEILIYDRYSIDTLGVIVRFPIEDYKLVVRRVHELVTMIRDITAQSVPLSQGVAGV